MANIRDLDKFKSTFWDWTRLNRCFDGTKIRITDVDGLVERNRCFLLIETKLPGNDIPQGQRILFDHLILLPRFSVLIIWGKTNCPQQCQLWGQTKILSIDWSGIEDYITRWFAWANQQSMDNDA